MPTLEMAMAQEVSIHSESFRFVSSIAHSL